MNAETGPKPGSVIDPDEEVDRQQATALVTIGASTPPRWSDRNKVLKRQQAEAASGQGSLLEPRPARMSDEETSWMAGRNDTQAKRVSRSGLKAQVLRLHQANNGLTDDELARWLPDDDRGTIAKRRGELVRDGELVNSGRLRRTRRGSAAIVWQVPK